MPTSNEAGSQQGRRPRVRITTYPSSGSTPRTVVYPRGTSPAAPPPGGPTLVSGGTPAGTVAANQGASPSQVAAANQAYHAQQQLIKQFVFKATRDNLIQKHIQFQNDKAVGIKVAPQVIGSDLHKAAEQIRSTNLKSIGLSRSQYHHIVGQNAQGKTVPVPHVLKMVKASAPARAALSKESKLSGAHGLIPFASHSIITSGTPKPKEISTAVGAATKRQLAPPKAVETTGEHLVKSLTGIDLNSSSPGSIPNTLVNVAAVGGGELLRGSELGARIADSVKGIPEALTAKASRGVKAVQLARADPKFALNAATLGLKGKAVTIGAAGGGLGAFEAAINTGLTGAEREAKATVQSPGKVLTTTLRTAVATPAAVAGILGDAALAAREGSLTPLKGQLDQQLSYWKQYGKIIGPSDKQAMNVIENKLGLVPAITAGLSAYGLVKGAGELRGAAEEGAIKETRKTRQARAILADPLKSSDEKRVALDELRSAGDESRKARFAGRKEGAQGPATAQAQTEGHLHQETTGGKSLRHPSTWRNKDLHVALGDLENTKVTKDVTLGHIATPLAIHGLYDNAPKGLVLDSVQKLLDDLPKKSHDPEGTTLRDAYKAILAHPEVLDNAKLQDYLRRERTVAEGRSQESHTELHATEQGAPKAEGPNPAHYEPTHMHIARLEGINLPGERLHPELRHLDYTPKAGKEADKAIRDRSKAQLKRAGQMERQAKTLHAAGEATKAETVARQAASLRSSAEHNLEVVNRHKTAAKLELQAARVEAGQAEGSPAALRAQAAEVKAKANEADAIRHAEFRGEMEKVKAEKGYANPIYTKESDLTKARDLRKTERQPFGPKGARKVQRRTAALVEKNKLDIRASTHLENFVKARFDIHLREVGRRLLFEHGVKAKIFGRETRFFTDKEIADKLQSGELPKGGEKMSVQDEAAAIQANASLRRDYEAAKTRAKTQPKGQRDIYAYIDSAALLKEHRAQRDEVTGKGYSFVRAVTHAQAGLLIATSPTWFMYQMGASPFALLVRHPNPMDWVQGLREMKDYYRKLSPYEKTSFQALAGVSASDFTKLHEQRERMTPEVVSKYYTGWKVANGSQVGKVLHGLKDFVMGGGGPFIRTNRRFENSVRVLGGLMEMDGKSGLNYKGELRLRHQTPLGRKVLLFGRSVAKLNDAVGAHMKALEGMTPAERIKYATEHPKLGDEVRKGLDDALGNWSRFTMNEKKLAAVTIFYGFIRFSARWFLLTNPKEEPIKTALLLNLSQANAVALQKIFHGSPSYFQTWGTVITHPQGKATPGINLARIAPGSNAILESIAQAGQTGLLSTLTAPFSPIIGITAQAAAGQTPSGLPAPGHSFGNLFLRGAAGLSTFTRPAESLLYTKSDLSNLYAAIQGKPSSGYGAQLKYGMTLHSLSLSQQRQTVKLDKLTKIAFQPGPSTFAEVENLTKGAAQTAGYKVWQAKGKAWNQIDAMYQQYGIQTPTEVKQGKADYIANHKAAEKRWGLFGSGKQYLIIPKSKGGSSSTWGTSSTSSSSGTWGTSSSSSGKQSVWGTSGSGASLKAPVSGKGKSQLSSSKQKPKVRSLPAPTTGFSSNAQVFGGELARLTGRSPAFIGSWMKHEDDVSQAKTSPQGTNNQNWLAVGYPGAQTPTSQNAKWWSDPVSAAKATYQYLKGDLPGYTAPSDITNAILGTHSDAEAGALLSQTSYAGAPGTYNAADQMSSIQTGQVNVKGGGAVVNAQAPATQVIKHAIKRYGRGTVVRQPQASAGGVPAIVNKGNGPEIYKALQALSAKLHTKVYVISGYRTPAQSASLPGGSANDPHTQGNAFDIGVGSPTLSSVAAVPEKVLNSVGLYRPYYPASAAEANHVELIGTGDGTGDPASGAGTPLAPATSSGGPVSSTPGTSLLASTGGSTAPVSGAQSRVNAAAKRAGISPVKLLGMVQRISAGKGVKIANLPPQLQSAISPSGTPTKTALAQLQRDYLTLAKKLQPTTTAA